MSTSQDMNQKLNLYRALVFGLVGLIVGGIGGYLIGHGTASGGSEAPTVVTEQPIAQAPQEDTAAGWSEQGTVMQMPEADPNAPLPVDVNEDSDDPSLIAFGWNYNTPVEGKDEVVMWEDFQCPACAAWERSGAPAVLLAAADKGDINLVFRPLSFLDMSLQNDSSQRATAAWGCAIDAGVGEKYRELVYANQPVQEGTGFTDEQLLSGGKLAGLEGDAYTKFEDCVKSGIYMKWSPTSSVRTPEKVAGTPSVTLNGELVTPEDLWEPGTLASAVGVTVEQ